MMTKVFSRPWGFGFICTLCVLSISPPAHGQNNIQDSLLYEINMLSHETFINLETDGFMVFELVRNDADYYPGDWLIACNVERNHDGAYETLPRMLFDLSGPFYAQMENTGSETVLRMLFDPGLVVLDSANVLERYQVGWADYAMTFADWRRMAGNKPYYKRRQHGTSAMVQQIAELLNALSNSYADPKTLAAAAAQDWIARGEAAEQAYAEAKEEGRRRKAEARAMALEEAEMEEAIFRSEEDEPVVKKPSYTGGQSALYSYLSAHVELPERIVVDSLGSSLDVDAGILIDETGRVLKVNVPFAFHRCVGMAVQETLERMPAWQPGTENGEPVEMWHKFSVKMRLN